MLKPTTYHIEVQVTEGLRPLPTIVTHCCGARYWKHTDPEYCFLCGRPLGEERAQRERNLDHLRHSSTRYWS